MAKIRKSGPDHYIIDYFDEKNRRHRRKIRANRRRALEALTAILSKVQERKLLGQAAPDEMLWEDMVQQWLDLHKSHQRSFKGNKRMLVKYAGVFRGKLLTEIRSRDVERWLANRRVGVSVATVNRDIAYLKGIFKKASELGYVHRSPIGHVKLAKENNARDRVLSDEEEARLFSVIDHEPLRMAVFLALNTGMRRGELLSLQWQDVKLADKVIVIPETKNGEPRTVPMMESVYRALRDWRLAVPGTWLFPSPDGDGPVRDMRSAFDRVLGLAGIKDFHWHDLRHTFATRLVRKGGNLRALQLLLGHKDIKTTMRYSNLDLKDMRASVSLLEMQEEGSSSTSSYPASRPAEHSVRESLTA